MSDKKRHELSPREFADEMLKGSTVLRYSEIKQFVDDLAKTDHQATLSLVANNKKKDAALLFLIDRMILIENKMIQMERDRIAREEREKANWIKPETAAIGNADVTECCERCCRSRAIV